MKSLGYPFVRRVMVIAMSSVFVGPGPFVPLSSDNEEVRHKRHTGTLRDKRRAVKERNLSKHKKRRRK